MSGESMGRAAGPAPEEGAPHISVHGFLRRRYCADGIAVALLLLAGVYVGSSVLKDWRGPAGTIGNYFMKPGLMWACGRGFVNVDEAQVPALADFIEQRSWSFDRAALPEHIETLPLTNDQCWHLFSSWTAGIAWRVFGLSWTSIKILHTALLILSLLLVYSLIRQVSGAAIALLLTILFLSSTNVLHTLACYRDFSKAPFFLGVFVLLTRLALGRVKTAGLLRYGFALGALIGIGLGFRRDLFVAVPAALLVLAVCPLVEAGPGIRWRLGGLILFSVVFCACGWPILRAFSNYGTLGSHDVIMGMSAACGRNIPMEPASYERIYIGKDSYVADSAWIFAHRTGRGLKPGQGNVGATEEMKREYMLQLMRVFPGDTLGRAVGTLLMELRGVPERVGVDAPGVPALGRLRVLWELLGRITPICFVVALFFAGLFSLRTAGLLLFLTAYFCWLVSLQVQYRHCFYLAVVPLVYFAAMLRRPAFLRAALARPEGLLRRAAWSVTFLLVIAAMAATVLWTARLVQKHNLTATLDLLDRAELTPIPIEAAPFGNWTIVRPAAPVTPQYCAPPPVGQEGVGAYLLADLEIAGSPAPCWIQYESDGGNGDFSEGLFIVAEPSQERQRVKYYFPVYELQSASGWSRFAGLAVPPGEAVKVHGLWQVKEAQRLDLWVNLAVPEKRAAFKYWQTYDFSMPGARGPSMDLLQLDDPRVAAMEAADNNGEETPQARLAMLQDALTRHPGNLQLESALLRVQLEQGLWQESVDTGHAILAEHTGLLAAWFHTLTLLEDRCPGEFLSELRNPLPAECAQACFYQALTTEFPWLRSSPLSADDQIEKD